jgi:uncharacterized membrane protein YphA (DoxX/SURF4 family)
VNVARIARIARIARFKAAARLAAVWIPTLFLVFVFAPQAWNKLSDTGGWAVAFRHWGYPAWFRILIGFVETGAALLLLWPRAAIAGAALIIAVMLGGTGTHIVKDNGRHVTSEVLPITLATIVLVLRIRSRESGIGNR